MKKSISIFTLAAVALAASGPVRAQWQKMDPAADVDKEFISGNPGVSAGVPAHADDNSCWMATASNMLAGAGYGNGDTLQTRAEDIYLDMLNWQVSIDPTNIHGVRDGGWIDTAINWWLGSANNTWGGSNPYTVVTVYGNTDCRPWANVNGPEFIGNELRDCQLVGLGIRWPRTTIWGSCVGGHAITAWGDNGNDNDLTANPTQIIVTDSDRDIGGDVQAYTYDNYTNPNPGGFNQGNGWYFNYLNGNNDNAYIVQAVTLCPTDSAVDPHDGPTQKVVGSYRIHQNQLEDANDLHYVVYTDTEILGYKTWISWPTANNPVIVESNAHHSYLDRDTIHVDWDLNDNPVPYCTWVTITTEFILPLKNYIAYEDVRFTYSRGESAKWFQPPDERNGVDIRVDDSDRTRRLLADDFRCTTRGKITKIHLWGSWLNDDGISVQPGRIRKFRLGIFSDDRVGDDPRTRRDDPNNTFSKPLDELWSGEFEDFIETEYVRVHEELFVDPYTDELGYDNRIWHYEINIPEPNAFMQRGTRRNPITYWLGVSAEVDGMRAEFGWKTTDIEHGWNDSAVMYDVPTGRWIELRYPPQHDFHYRPVDLAFGIVTGGSVFGPLFPPLIMEVQTPLLADANVPDITGGYVIGSFDIWDWVGDDEEQAEHVAEYRFIHEYDYIQDPEYHTFTIQGPNAPSGVTYVATNFRFGHNYGMLDTESLWKFNEWMTVSPSSAILSEGEPFELRLDWDTLLPYPQSNITPIERVPGANECTVYLQADLNKDCYVDFKDLAILAEQWLHTTAFGENGQ